MFDTLHDNRSPMHIMYITCLHTHIYIHIYCMYIYVYVCMYKISLFTLVYEYLYIYTYACSRARMTADTWQQPHNSTLSTFAVAARGLFASCMLLCSTFLPDTVFVVPVL